MTSPTNTRHRVTVNSQRSALTRFAMRNSFHHAGARARKIFAVNSLPQRNFLGSIEVRDRIGRKKRSPPQTVKTFHIGLSPRGTSPHVLLGFPYCALRCCPLYYNVE